MSRSIDMIDSPYGRSVQEWKGATPDSVPPPEVRIRVFDRHGGRCHVCTRKIAAGEYWQNDHVVAIINGGENRERNLKPACKNCCYKKTGEDLAEKSERADIRKKHILPTQKRPWSKYKRKMDGSVVLRADMQEEG